MTPPPELTPERYDAEMTVYASVFVNDSSVIERITGPDGDEWRSQFYDMHTAEEVIEHLVFNAVTNGIYDASGLDGWTLDLDGGASCYVEQGRYGLPVKKPTWLYAYGVELPALRWGYRPAGEGSLAVDQRPDRGGMHAWRDAWRPQVTDGRWIDGRQRRTTAADGRQRGAAASRTPVEFRDVLLDMARSAAKVAA